MKKSTASPLASLVTRHSSLLVMLLAAYVVGSAQAQTLSNYQFVVSSQSPAAYFKLDGTLTDSVTPSQSLTPSLGFFTADAVHHPTNAYAFLNASDALSLGTDIIPGGDPAGTNAAANGVGSISILFRALDSSSTGQRFIFSQGSGVTSNGNALALFFENNTSTNSPGDLKLRVGNTTTSILASNAIAYDQWYLFAMTYDETRDTGEVLWYLGRSGGTLASGTVDIGNDAVVGDNGTVVLGNAVDLASGFRNPGEGRVDEFAVWNRELSPTEVANAFAQLPNYFPSGATYQTLVSAQRPAHYYKLDNSLADSVSGGPTLSVNGPSGAFAADIVGIAGHAYSFSETNDALYTASDIINGGGPSANGAAAAVGTISLLFRMLDATNNTGQRYIFAQGGTSANSDQLALFIENTNVNNTPVGTPNSLKLRVGNGPTTAILLAQYIITNAWYYFAMTYDESRNSQSGGEVRYSVGPVGGGLTNGAIDIGNTAVVGDNGIFAIGNRESLTNNAFRNPGTGLIDEVAIWNDELSQDEIYAQFAAISAQAAPAAPSLQITVAQPNAIISWPSSTPSSYALEATPSLAAPATWTNAGGPTSVGNSYYVTNLLGPTAQFYRLHKGP